MHRALSSVSQTQVHSAPKAVAWTHYHSRAPKAGATHWAVQGWTHVHHDLLALTPGHSARGHTAVPARTPTCFRRTAVYTLAHIPWGGLNLHGTWRLSFDHPSQVGEAEASGRRMVRGTWPPLPNP